MSGLLLAAFVFVALGASPWWWVAFGCCWLLDALFRARAFRRGFAEAFAKNFTESLTREIEKRKAAGKVAPGDVGRHNVTDISRVTRKKPNQ